MCVFCQIVNREIPKDIIYEDEKILVFEDIKPSAPLHLLIIPKKHIKSLAEMVDTDQELLGKLVYKAKELAAENGLAGRGYKVVINTGQEGGQIVEHLHVHLLGGGPLIKLV